jgi:hypothetical protein
VIPRVETPRSAPTVTFSAATPAMQTSGKSAAAVTGADATHRRRRWPWVLGVLGVIAIGSSTMVRLAREARETRYANAQRDSTRRADSLRKVEQARTDSVNSAHLVGGMVDTVKSAEQLRADSIATANKALQNAVVSVIRRYATALEKDDKAAARSVFPKATDRDLASWDAAREKYDLKFSVASPSRVRLSLNNLVADLDFMLQVQYVDRETRAPYITSKLPRHATLTKQKQRWELDALRDR